MNKRERYLILIFFTLSLFICLSLYFTFGVGQMHSMRKISNDLIRFASKNDGRLPKNESEFISFGISDNINFEKFKINYGLHPGDIIFENNRIYLKQTKKELFIIRGKYYLDPWAIGNYRKSSMKIYKEMLKGKIKGEEK